ncbi:MAG: DUF2779 domain-containing protein [Nanoarchaeota archaeon]|nr:DUF2779 domain-containing protein [Nanoarchaeota archaeon]
MTLLTKSRYVHGLVCPRFLWIEVHEKDKLPEVDMATQHRFDQGHLVGEMAKECFPKGIDLAGLEFKENIEKTKKAVRERKVIFEAGIMFKNIFSRADILVPVGKDEWDVIEVKSSTQVKDEHLHDLSFQRFTYEQAGLNIRNCVVMHINNQFIKQGKIKPQEFFTQEDITKDVDEASKGIQERIESMLKLIASPTFSEKIAGGCTQPGECVLEECWKHLPEHHIFTLCGLKKKQLELFEQGIVALKDIPDSVKLNDKQQIQRDCAKSGKPHIHKEEIATFLRTLKYPLCYLDFETFSTAIPLFDGVKPYQQIPFQFSLHVDNGKKVEHFGFLADGTNDPRKEFIETLQKVLPKSGNVVVYNGPFEKGVLTKLAELYPEYKEWVTQVVNRFADLLIPFRNFHYYHPDQKGSASIKAVLPVLTGNDYKDLEIGKGDDASVSFLAITFGKVSSEEKQKVRRDLEVYCGQDTEGMRWIVKELEEMVEVSKRK